MDAVIPFVKLPDNSNKTPLFNLDMTLEHGIVAGSTTTVDEVSIPVIPLLAAIVTVSTIVVVTMHCPDTNRFRDGNQYKTQHKNQ